MVNYLEKKIKVSAKKVKTTNNAYSKCQPEKKEKKKRVCNGP